MSSQDLCSVQREQELRKLIRSLSKVSEVETREIRANIEKEARFKNRNRRRRQVEGDGLLKERRALVLPNLLSSYRLFESKDKKIESLKQRYIDSQAFLKRANFEYKKIELKKQDIAHRQQMIERSHASAVLLQNSARFDEKNANGDPFATPNHHSPGVVDPVLVERLKTTVHSSHKEMKNLYQSHIRQINSLSFRQRMVSEHIKSEADSAVSSQSNTQGPEPKATQSVILKSREKRPQKQALKELIRVSSSRVQQEVETIKPTSRQKEQQLQTQLAILEMQAGIQQSNRLKQSLALGQLKKLLYGERKGKFIQDSTFRTRLRGEYSEQYMNVVQKQQQILNSFNGSYINRKNLVEKFANILGTLRKHASKDDHELTL